MHLAKCGPLLVWYPTMTKRESLIPVVVVGLAIGFVVVSLLVVLTRGNPKWVSKKLRIGAMLLTLTGVATGCGTETTCYDPLPPENGFYLDDYVYPGQEVDVDFAQSNVIHGSIDNRSGEAFSFRLVDSADQELQREDILAADGAFDSYTEEFDITLRTDLSTGTYHLFLFATLAADQPDTGDVEFILNVTNN